MPIETPTLEELDVLTAGGGQTDETISLFDSDGRLLALRPDVTLPIARMIASRLRNDDGPFRLRYAQQVFREQESLQAQEREFTQLGVESIGTQGVWADAEVVSLFVEALRACNLREFTVAICTVSVLKAIIEESDMDPQWAEDVLEAFHTSNFVSLQDLADRDGVDDEFRELLLELPHVRGGRDAIVRCRQLVAPLGHQEDLDRLLLTWDVLEAQGCTDHVVVDFSIMCSFDYYTGLAVEAYAPGFGLPLGSGGRYDHMLEAYGRNMPAAGFAFSLERVMQALRRQGDKVYPATPRALIGGSCAGKTFVAAAKLRKQGVDVCITDAEDLLEEASKRGIAAVYRADEQGDPIRMDEGSDRDV